MASEKPISVGDLVIVVRGAKCCGDPSSIGRIFKVSGLTVSGSRHTCGAFLPPQPVAELEGFSGFCNLYRLKRIPPLDELETVRTEDEVTA